jgi:hypothetical protein
MIAVRVILCLPTLAWLLTVPPGMCFCELAALVGLPRACEGPASTDLGHPDSPEDHDHTCPKVKDPASVPPTSPIPSCPVFVALGSHFGLPSSPAAAAAQVRLDDPDPGGHRVPLHLILRTLRN